MPDVKQAVTRKVGPLPLYGWAGLGIGTILIVRALRGGGGGGGGGTVTVPDAFGGTDTIGSGGNTGGGSGDNSGGGTGSSIDPGAGYGSGTISIPLPGGGSISLPDAIPVLGGSIPLPNIPGLPTSPTPAPAVPPVTVPTIPAPPTSPPTLPAPIRTIIGYTVKIVGTRTAVYNANGTVNRYVSNASYATKRELIGGKWHYTLTDPRFSGQYLLAQPYFTVTPIYSALVQTAAMVTPTSTAGATSLTPVSSPNVLNYSAPKPALVAPG